MAMPREAVPSARLSPYSSLPLSALSTINHNATSGKSWAVHFWMFISLLLLCKGQWHLHFVATLKKLKHLRLQLWCWMQCCCNKESSYFHWNWWAHGWVWGFWNKALCEPFVRWVVYSLEYNPFCFPWWQVFPLCYMLHYNEICCFQLWDIVHTHTCLWCVSNSDA